MEKAQHGLDFFDSLSLVKIYKAPSYHNNSAMYRGR